MFYHSPLTYSPLTKTTFRARAITPILMISLPLFLGFLQKCADRLAFADVNRAAESVGNGGIGFDAEAVI